MKVWAFAFDGSAEEFNSAHLHDYFDSFDSPRAGRGGVMVRPESPAVEEPEAVAVLDAWPPASALSARLAEDEQFLRRMLERLPVPPGQRELYGVLGAAKPDAWVSRQVMCDRMGRTHKQLDGILGALGKRVNGTTRDDMTTEVGIGVLFEFRGTTGDWQYRLRPTFRRVLRQVGLI